MQSIEFIKECPIAETPRTIQLRGLFDLSASKTSFRKWSLHVDFPDDWNVGVIVGPSGSGKSSFADELYKDSVIRSFDWSKDKSVVDNFPESISIREITNLLSSVGFSSPPSWLRPFHCLSTGEQFRCLVARSLCSSKSPIVLDEFTSVVDRTVAKIGSVAIAKAVRRNKIKFVAVSCHYDILEWLEPDWVYEPHMDKFTAGRNLRRPEIKLEILKCTTAAWPIFREHHYLNTTIATSAQCFLALLNDQPVAFSSVLHFPHPKHPNTKREHRTVCLPDFQGVGIGNALSDFIAAMCRGIGSRYLSITSHPSMIVKRLSSKNWRLISRPSITRKTMPSCCLSKKGSGKFGPMAQRLSCTFEFVGKPMEQHRAHKLFYGEAAGKDHA